MNAQDLMQRTVLHVCALRQQSAAASIILDRNPGLINRQDRSGKTSLHYAVDKSSRAMVKLLLEKGADVNILDMHSNAPLHVAILKHDTFICNVMIESKVGVELSLDNLEHAWNLAVEAGASFIMALLQTLRSNSSKLLTGGDLHTNAALTHTKRSLALVLTAESSSDFTAADLDFMLELGRDPGFSGDTSPCTPAIIRSAIIRGAGNAATFLLRRSAIDLHCLGEDGESVLHLAVVYDAQPVVKLLLDNDEIDLTSVDPQGHTALHLALLHKRLHIFQMLLESSKVKPEQVTSSGATALHLAIKHRFSEAIPLLLAHPETQANCLDNSGRTALHHAVLQQDLAVVRLLLGSSRVIAETPSRDGRTALAYAALSAGEDMVLFLLNTGKFDQGQKDSYGKTALDWAHMNIYPQISTILRSTG
ncbi:hypothetical protein G7Z17_g4704 [Cylindrodendrum hubeiense]|uniref:Uncharacterized protein n=1 Tax=Cylindrodendrum hubeiense TaxID=595255 RepID=A0A9P5HIL5_9HYPO|nr:hypothetical protein G7Z17_g4704 [Cylindrodendrum hubeiense]